MTADLVALGPLTPHVGITYLSGGFLSRLRGVHPRLGVMLQPGAHNRPDLSETRWAADNGLFTAKGEFRNARYLAWLETWQQYRTTCLFATAPDVYPDALATLERSRYMMAEIRALGYPVALVAQDGLETCRVPWDQFDCLFTGGTTRWKLSEAAYALIREAKRQGKHTHMGRCNSLRRLRRAAAEGYDSADGTYIAYSPDLLLPRVMGWLDSIAAQPALREA